MTATTKKEIKLKDGNTLPKGCPVTFIPNEARICLVQGDRTKPYKIRVSSAFRAPSLNSLEEQSNDGVCNSVLGERVEPDGWDCHGSPSWLLALGMI